MKKLLSLIFFTALTYSQPALNSHAAWVYASGSGTSTTVGQTTTGATLLVAACAGFNADVGAATVSDSKSNTWLHIPDVGTGHTSQSGTIFYVVNPIVGASHTFSCAVGNANGTIATMASFTGVRPTSPQDKTAAGSFSVGATTRQPGAVTPSQSNTLLVTLVVNSGSTSVTQSINSSYTITDAITDEGGAHDGGALAYFVQTSRASINPTWTISSSGQIMTSEISFRALSTAVSNQIPIIAFLDKYYGDPFEFRKK